MDCHKRFYARRVPLRYLLYARCPRCASLQLLRMRRRTYEGAGIRLARLLGARILHCDFCRQTFPSWRPFHASEEMPAEEHFRPSATGARR